MEVKSVARRQHSDELKAEVIAACRRGETTVAAIARSYGLRANLVHKWLRKLASPLKPRAKAGAANTSAQAAGFVAVRVSTPQPGVMAAPADIRIELRRGATTVKVSWPAQMASECAAWLREWLQ